MTQEEALEEFKKIFPEHAERLTVEHEHKIGYEYGNMDIFYLWDHSGRVEDTLVGSSSDSWEDALLDASDRKNHVAEEV